MREIFKFAAVIAIVAGAGFGFISLQERKGYGLKAGVEAPDFRLPIAAPYRPGGRPSSICPAPHSRWITQGWCIWIVVKP